MPVVGKEGQTWKKICNFIARWFDSNENNKKEWEEEDQCSGVSVGKPVAKVGGAMSVDLITHILRRHETVPVSQCHSFRFSLLPIFPFSLFPFFSFAFWPCRFALSVGCNCTGFDIWVVMLW